MSHSGENKNGEACPDNTSRYYRPQLDWLRFIAFLMVFAFHAKPAGPLTIAQTSVPGTMLDYLWKPLAWAGSHGVDIFFVLSAFLITELLLREKAQHGAVHIRSFYVRRILRIWPLYFVFALIVFPLDFYVFRGDSLYYAMLLAFIGNWYNVCWGGFFTSTGHLWTVSVEEQFYLVWPHLAQFFSVRAFRRLLVNLLVISALYRFATIYLLWPDASAVYEDTLARMDCFAVGGLLALAYHRKEPRFGRFLGLCLFLVAAAGFWTIGMAADETHGASALWSFPLATAGAAAMLVAMLTVPAASVPGRIARSFGYLGKISYGLYMWHVPAGFLVAYAFGIAGTNHMKWPVLTATVGFAVTLIAAMLSYAMLERPFLRFKQRFTYVASRPL